MSVRIEQLNIYPVKSLAGISLQSSILEPEGLQYDRQWMLVDQNGKFISQRSDERLALFKTFLSNNELIISYKDSQISVSLEANSHSDLEVEVWQHHVMAEQQNKEVNEWFRDHLQEYVSLVRYGALSERIKVQPYASMPLRFADGYPLLIANQASLNALNKELDRPVPMNRFRPNIVVSGLQAWEEFKTTSFKNDKGAILVAKPCERCVVTTIDQKTALKDKKEPLRTLVALNGSPAIFGVNAYSHDLRKLEVMDSFDKEN